MLSGVVVVSLTRVGGMAWKSARRIEFQDVAGGGGMAPATTHLPTIARHITHCTGVHRGPTAAPALHSCTAQEWQRAWPQPPGCTSSGVLCPFSRHTGQTWCCSCWPAPAASSLSASQPTGVVAVSDVTTADSSGWQLAACCSCPPSSACSWASSCCRSAPAARAASEGTALLLGFSTCKGVHRPALF